MSKAMYNTGRGWSWELEDGSLCHWAEPNKYRLQGDVPSPEAKRVAVRIIREKDYREILERLKEKTK